jgi:putative N6-adenine-specific DNA methylase
MERYFATTVKGIEPMLLKELEGLGAKTLEPGSGGVGFEADIETAYRANLWLRTALRVLQPVANFHCATADDLYRAAYHVDWKKLVSPDGTMAVRANVRDNVNITHSKFAALKVKDAVCDRIRDDVGRRPNVDVESPDLALDLHLAGSEGVLSIDMSGDSLHRRGYRLERTEAPLRETLAAAIVDFTGWEGKTPFVDLMCGSGTFVIEAALKAARMAPGLLGRSFAFERLLDFDRKLWDRVTAEARKGVRATLDVPILGFDKDRDAIATSRANAKRAGVEHLVKFETQPLSAWKAPVAGGPGTIVVNPPYGERMGDEKSLEPLYTEIGDVFKREGQGYTGWVLTANKKLGQAVGLRPSAKIPLWNGPLESRLLKFELYAASRKTKYQKKDG